MKTEIDEQSLQEAATVIARGGVIAFRTDTFYGLGADPFNCEAVQRIKQLKGSHKPILIIISDREQVGRFIRERSDSFNRLAERFWPGPLTLIGKSAPEVPDEITAGTGTVGVRLPDDDNVRALLRACGGALTATSANPSNREPPKTAQEVNSYFGDAIDLIVDGGKTRSDLPSTVLDVCDAEPKLIRAGVLGWLARHPSDH